MNPTSIPILATYNMLGDNKQHIDPSSTIIPTTDR